MHEHIVMRALHRCEVYDWMIVVAVEAVEDVAVADDVVVVVAA